MESRFILDDERAGSVHAVTLVETAEGLLATWFGGLHEGASDTTVWLARFRKNAWGEQRNLLSGAAAEAEACWNPVLCRVGKRILLFYRVGPDPRTWTSKLAVSDDEGATWQAARPLPDGYLGPIKNKPLELEDGVLLCPSSIELPKWDAHVEGYAPDQDRWLFKAPMADPEELWPIQPTLLPWSGTRIQALCRSGARVVAESWSEDAGLSWSALKPTALANPNSAIDGLILADGRAALVLNPLSQARTPLMLLLSDDGRRWRPGPLLEQEVGEFSYPAIIQATDGLIHVAYTYNRRRIRHVTLTPEELE